MVSKEITIRNHTFEECISMKDLESAISKIADQINCQYMGQDDLPVFLIVLTGGLFFGTELLKRIEFTSKIGFVKCSSYMDGMSSSGNINLIIEPTIDIFNKKVIVLEDIIDTGLTWKYLHKHLNDLGAKEVKIATMLLKKESIEHPAPVDWHGPEVDNRFIVGMGLDYGDLGRNFPAIYKLKQ